MNWIQKISQTQYMLNFPDMSYYESFDRTYRPQQETCHLCHKPLTPDDIWADIWIRPSEERPRVLEFNFDPQMLRKMIDNYFTQAQNFVDNFASTHTSIYIISKEVDEVCDSLNQMLDSSIGSQNHESLSYITDPLKIYHFNTIEQLKNTLKHNQSKANYVIHELKRRYDVQYQYPEFPVCLACSEQELERCAQCNQWIDKEDVSTVVAEENYYCSTCAGQYISECEVCNDMFHASNIHNVDTYEEGDHSLCTSCFNSTGWLQCDICGKWITNNNNARQLHNGKMVCPDDYTGNKSMAWDVFGDRDLLHQADQEIPVTDDEYITIFSKFPWDSSYGGERWAEIARTNKELKKLAKQKYNIDTPKASMWIDHAFDLAHNTGSLFTKMPLSIKEWLLMGLEQKKNLPPFKLIPNTSPEVQRLMLTYMWLTGGVGEYQLEASKIAKQHAQTIAKDIEDMNSQHFLDQIQQHQLTPMDFIDTPIYPLVLAMNSKELPSNIREYLYQWVSYPVRNFVYDFLGYIDPDALNNNLALVLQVINIRIEYLANLIKNNTNLNVEAIIQQPSQLTSMTNMRKWFILLQDSLKQTAANKTAMLKEAQLNKNTFFDFYVLNYMNEEEFYEEDRALVAFLKKYNILQLLGSLTDYIDKSLTREARHVGTSGAIDYYLARQMYEEQRNTARQPNQVSNTEMVQV